MKTFFINLDKFEYQIEDTLDSIIRGYEALWTLDNKVLKNYDWPLEKQKIRRFPLRLLDLVEQAILEQDGTTRKDIFGNTFLRATYKYIQITSVGKDMFASVRFLGEKSNGEKTRFYVKKIKHSFEPTTLNFVQNLSDIIAPNCNTIKKVVDRNLINTNYSWEKIRKEIFSPPAEVGPILDISLFTKAFLEKNNERMQKNFQNSEEVNQRNIEFQGLISILYQKNKDSIETAPNSLNAMKNELSSSEEPQLTEREERLEQEREKLRKTLDKIGNLPSKFDSKVLIADALQCLIPGSCEEFIRRLPIKHTLNMIKGMLPKDCPTYTEVLEAVDSVLLGQARKNKIELDELQVLIQEQETRYQQISSSLETQEDILNINNEIQQNFNLEKVLFILKESYEEVEDIVSDQKKKNDLSKIKEDVISKINNLSANDPLYVVKLDNIKNLYKNWFSVYSEEISGKSVFSQLEYNLEVNKEKASNLREKITTEIEYKIRDLKLSERQIALVNFETLNMEEVYSNVQAFNQEELKNFNNTKERIYDQINTIVPLYGLCKGFGDVIDNILDIFSKFPEPRKLTDIFAGLSEEIILILLNLLAEIVLLALEILINTLLNCSNIDALVALILGEASPGGLPGLNDIGSNLLSGAGDMANSSLGKLMSEVANIDAVASILDIYGNAEPLFWAGYYESLKIDELVQQKIDNSSNIKDFDENEISVFDYEAVYKYLEAFSSWDVDEDEEDFIVSSENKIIKMEDFDRAMAISSTEAINVIPAGIINEGLFRSINKGQSEKEVFNSTNSEKPLFSSPQVMKEELGEAIFSTTAICTPSEIINALAGQMSDDTAAVAAEVMRNSAPNLSRLYNLDKPGNDDNIKTLFANLGKQSGLDNLLPQLQLLADLPEVQDRLIGNKLCQPYDNIGDFRAALLSRIVPEEDAREIIDNINNEKIDKYIELTDSLISLGQGFAPKDIEANPTIRLLQDINDKLFNPLKQEQQKEQIKKPDSKSDDLKEFSDSNKTIDNFIKDKMKDRMEKDPIYKSMLQTTMDSIMNPLKDSFKSAMQGYADGNAEEIEREVLISRFKNRKLKNGTTVKTINDEFKDYINSGMVPIVRNKEGDPASKDFNKDFNGVNKKFCRLANKDTLVVHEANLDDLRVSGHASNDFTKPGFYWKALVNVEGFTFGFEDPDRVKRPILVKKKKKEYGVSFIDGLSELLKIENEKSKLESYFGENPKEGLILEFSDFKSKNSDIAKLIDKISIGGDIEEKSQSTNSNKFSNLAALQMPQQIETLTGVSLSSLKQQIPSWGVKLYEEGQSTTIKVDIKGSSLSRNKGLVMFSDSYTQTYQKILVDKETKKSLEILFPESSKTRKQAFHDLIKQNYNNVQTQIENNRKIGSLEIQNKMFENIKKSVTNILINSKLFKKTSLSVSDNEEEKQYIYFLQLFDFAREPTKQESERGFDPNIMGWDAMGKRFQEIYSKEPEVEDEEEQEKQISSKKRKKKTRSQRNDGKTKKRTRFTNACYKMILEIVVKLAVVQFCLQTLPVLESLKFSKGIINNDFLIDFMKKKVKESIETMGIYRIFKREADLVRKENYEIWFEKNVIFNFEQVLDHFAKIFHICDKDRHIDSLKQEMINSLEVLDIHDRNSNNEGKFLKQKLVKGEIKQVLSEDAITLRNLMSEKLSFLNQQDSNSDQNSTFSIASKGEKLKKALKKIQEIKDENSTLLNINMQNMWVEKKEQDSIEIEERYKKGDIVLQRYIRFGKINNQNFKSNFEDKTMSIQKARQMLSEMGRIQQKLYDCENPESGIFKEAPRFGLRLVYVADVSTNYTCKHKIGNSSFSVFEDNKNLFRIKEKVGNKTNYYNLFELYSEELPIGTNNLTIDDMITGNSALLSLDNFNNYFYPILHKKMYSSDKSRVAFDYCFGIKELIGVGAIHNYFLSNSENIKFMFEAVGEIIKRIFQVLDNFGDKTKTNETLNAMREETRIELENEGNPAGPIGPFAVQLLKIFIRTPIHILKELATIVDPNIFIANFIVAGVSISGAIIGKKLWIPYIAASLGLFPAPLFVPPYMIPLTAYNIAVPLGPIFLFLEWILWDLPWYQAALSESELGLETLKEYGIDNNNDPINKPDCQDDIRDQIIGSEYDSFIDGKPSAPFLDSLINKIKEECGDK